MLEQWSQHSEARDCKAPCQADHQPETIDQGRPAFAVQVTLPPGRKEADAKPWIESALGVEGSAQPVRLHMPPTHHDRWKETLELTIETERLTCAAGGYCDQDQVEAEHESH